MKLFGRDKETIRVKRAKASRAVFALQEEVMECNLRLITEDGEMLELIIPDRILPYLIQDLSMTYEAIHPPLRSGNRQALWQGMDNGQ